MSNRSLANSSFKKNAPLMKLKTNSALSKKGPSGQQSLDNGVYSNVDDEYDENGTQDDNTLETILRDSLIKSFMVIFTHDHSQHLLLNKDLIEIAFNCLEFCSEISIEAKQKLAKLISIIFKFPQVQEKLLASEVIIGINELLEQHAFEDILKHTVKACTFLSMNYEFVSTSLSLDILKNLMPLLNKF